MSGFKGKKKVFSDIIWSIMALMAMHGVLQIVVYPSLNKRWGAEAFGDILYILAVIGILAPAIGLAANNTRLIQRKKLAAENGDYLVSMLLQLVPAVVVFVILLHPYLNGAADMLLGLAVLALTMLRSYGDVEYRLSLHYKGYFLYYLAISAGYLLGLLLLPVWENWLVCFLLGELFAFLLVSATGSIYRPLTCTKQVKSVFRGSLVLAGSYLLYNAVLYIDRILLQNLMDSESVTIYYVASLLGKTAALLVGPLNGVIIGYLTKDDRAITAKQFLQASGIAVVLGGLGYLAILVVTPLFVRIFYPDIAASVLQFAWLSNLSQILCFIASPLLTVMLTFCQPKWQLIIQSIYAAEFIVLSIVGVQKGGLQGFIMAGLLANAIRLILVLAVGFGKLKTGKTVKEHP